MKKAGLSEPGGRQGHVPPPHILSDQLTLSQPGGGRQIMPNTLLIASLEIHSDFPTALKSQCTQAFCSSLHRNKFLKKFYLVPYFLKWFHPSNTSNTSNKYFLSLDTFLQKPKQYVRNNQYIKFQNIQLVYSSCNSINLASLETIYVAFDETLFIRPDEFDGDFKLKLSYLLCLLSLQLLNKTVIKSIHNSI